MGQGTTSFLLGVLAFQQLPVLPAPAWALTFVPLAVLAVRFRALRLPAACAAGFLWSLLHAQHILAPGLVPDLEGRDLEVEGVIVSIPERLEGATRFQFRVERMGDGAPVPPPGRVRLSWYNDAPELRAGERWRLRVRMKRPHGFHNPGGFDFEGWLYQNRIRATGYVRPAADNRRLETAAPGYLLQRVRQDLFERLDGTLAGRELGGVISALAIGERQGITQGQWDVFRRTGTTHLVAISGLHVGMISGLVFFAVRRLWARLGRVPLYWPAQQAAAVAALAAAFVYAALAGFSIPTQRTVVMIGVVMLAVLRRRHHAPGRTLMTALLCVLLLDPLAVMNGGFWLSFGAVAAILFGMNQRAGREAWWLRVGRLHVLVAVALAPLLLALFQQVSLVSPLANLVAVPWVTLGVVPLVLAGCALQALLPALGAPLLRLAEAVLSWLWPLLERMSSYDALQWTQPVPAGWTIAAAAIGVTLLIAPRGLPGRWLGIVWLLPALLVAPARPAAGELWFTLLDVGQGLAAVAWTRDHVLVYDTGPRFSADFDAGSAVLLPFLRFHGLEHIDTLVIGHGDNDHIGGAAALSGEVSVGRVLSSVPDRIPWWHAEHCRRGQAWDWDGIRFEVLHPGPGGGFAGNDASCVLRIANAAGAILLTGDIEEPAEARLVRDDSLVLSADVLVAPHHGSKSSSSAPFIARVGPRHVLFPAGYRNRWGFPHPVVTERYRSAGAVLYSSAEHGALTVRLPAAGQVEPPAAHRREFVRYWHAR
ncbi:MAG: DNA internalization-related competence protein ComEC/Rec2 [Gammaproteobacteria bacterium]|nr:DNA internalization-related competence protein ComEC/Rec2 [Gammaproteobacteria bacterium]